MKSSRLIYNTISPLFFQLTTIICGFILPRLLLKNFGSEINGLVSSISQYLAIIGFLEFGIGSVVRTAFYKPLAENDYDGLSRIVLSSNAFFKKIAYLLLFYTFSLMIVYPFIVRENFSWLFLDTLIFVMATSIFCQYYFGITDQILLNAAQYGYIQYNIQSFAMILNTICCYILILLDSNILIIKIVSAIVFIIRPICLRLYINKTFNINRKISYHNEPIKQKWNGLSQHFSGVIFDSSAVIILTFLSTLSFISIYSIYWIIILGIKRLVISLTDGITSYMGQIYAVKDNDRLRSIFDYTEWLVHFFSVIIFSSTTILIVPFIQVYVDGIHDANYIVPFFGCSLVLAYMGQCLRLPYHILILSSGLFKETRLIYSLPAILYLILMFLFTPKFNLIGISCSAFFSLYIQLFWNARYVYNDIFNKNFILFLKQIFVDFVCVIISVYLFYSTIYLKLDNYFDWIILANKVLFSIVIITFSVNFAFYKNYVNYFFSMVYKYLK